MPKFKLGPKPKITTTKEASAKGKAPLEKEIAVDILKLTKKELKELQQDKYKCIVDVSSFILKFMQIYNDLDKCFGGY